MPCIVILKVIFIIEWFLTIVTYESLSWFFLAKVGWRHVPTTVVTSCDPPIFPDGRHHKRRVWWWTSLLLNRWNSLVCFPYVNLQTFFISENILTLVTLKSAILVETIEKIGEPAVNQNWFKSVKNWKLDRWKQFRSPAKPVKSVKTWAMETI